MCKTTGKVRILLVGPSPLLEAEAKDVEHPAIAFATADPSRIAASREAARDYDVVVVNLDHIGGLDLLADLCARPGAGPVIGLGALGVPGRNCVARLSPSRARSTPSNLRSMRSRFSAFPAWTRSPATSNAASPGKACGRQTLLQFSCPPAYFHGDEALASC